VSAGLQCEDVAGSRRQHEDARRADLEVAERRLAHVRGRRLRAGPPPDVDGDIISPGAFDDTIAEARARREQRGGRSMWPVLWAHIAQPEFVIGAITAATMVGDELIVEGTAQRRVERQREQGLRGDACRRHQRVVDQFRSRRVAPRNVRRQGRPVPDRLSMIEMSAMLAGANRFTQGEAQQRAPTTSSTWVNDLLCARKRYAWSQAVSSRARPNPSVAAVLQRCCRLRHRDRRAGAAVACRRDKRFRLEA
jgi:hypothetical protein